MMNKNDLLRCVAETGYNVGFGAKKHFSTHDITDKVPAVIGVLSTIGGIYSLSVEALSSNWVASGFGALAVLSLSISGYNKRKDEYLEVGSKLTGILNRLKHLYFRVKSASEADLAGLREELESLEKEAGELSIGDQILFSGWFAHYKFFCEHQIEWIDEQKKFGVRDKIPLSFFLVLGMGVIVGGVLLWRG